MVDSKTAGFLADSGTREDRQTARLYYAIQTRSFSLVSLSEQISGVGYVCRQCCWQETTPMNDWTAANEG